MSRSLQTREEQFHYLISAAKGSEAADVALARARQLSEPHRTWLIDDTIRDLLDIAEGKSEFMERVAQRGGMHYNPVGVEEFLCAEKYLNKGSEIYPRVMDHIIEINSGEYDEAVMTGAIGTAKTTIAVLSTAYQLYLVAAYINPHAVFGLDRSSEIEFVFQSLDYTKAKEVGYSRFKELVDQSEFFRHTFPYNKDIQSQMHFPNRVIVKPVTGTQTATIGQNVYGGIIDEVNYMEKIEKSTKSRDGGEYDQATALYNSIARRRESRFMRLGKLPGVLFLVSSKRYPGQFTDQKEQEAKREIAKYGKTSIYIYDKRTWEVLPEDRFSGERFRVFVGDSSRTPHIMHDEEKVTPIDRELILSVPVEFRKAFDKDIMESLREIGGVSTLAQHPFLMNREAVSSCFGKHKSIFNRREVELDTEQVCVFPERFVNLQHPRWCHIDPSLTGDSMGLVIGHLSHFTPVERGEKVELAPHVVVDGSLRIRPPRGGEIKYWRVRELLYKLYDLGLPLRWITLDSFQSRDFIQQVGLKGFLSFVLSLDKKPDGYVFLKSALYDGRVDLPAHQHLQDELLALEYDAEKQKIDHPPDGSKDIADGLAGVVWGLSTRTELMVQHGVPLRQSTREGSTSSAPAEHITIAADRIKETEPVATDPVEVVD